MTTLVPESRPSSLPHSRWRETLHAAFLHSLIGHNVAATAFDTSAGGTQSCLIRAQRAHPGRGHLDLAASLPRLGQIVLFRHELARVLHRGHGKEECRTWV